ncbi:CoA transferase [Geothrix sp.]|jgi:crotonobetainyl-CoA:carnitine CoA-transferase CaiB-like acyl-CoA transferase|uniref:CaiB/BaiF CoA transferase family protein n=1 Tax=Geothrix sp. TaxID=1962974 RepID=UPI0025B86506|nr:CoA transferase [Geothrix sp.]
MSRKILEGIKVLDLTNVLSGPFTTLHLALLGAEVIKVENPKDGDLARKLGIVPDLNKKLMGTSFLAQNCNKKSITLNTKSPEGKEIFRKLVKDADVVVENFRPGVMDRLGLGYKTLAELNPRLIYCAISGFGQTGPDALKPAYDQIIQGLSGEMAVNGDERLNPLRTGFPVCDTVGGLNAAFAVMAALFHRERTGQGQAIDIALLDSIMPLMGWVAANLLIGGEQPVLMGNDNFTAAPSGTFRTQDGHINIAANKQEQWEAVCEVLEVPELKTDPRFQERDTRKKNRRELTPLLEARLVQKATAFWVEALNAKDVPSGDILSLEDALRQPQVQHRKVLQKVAVAGVGEVEVFGLTALFEKTPGEVEAPPPALGEHNALVYGHLGLGEGELAELKSKGII